MTPIRVRRGAGLAAPEAVLPALALLAALGGASALVGGAGPEGGARPILRPRPDRAKPALALGEGAAAWRGRESLRGGGASDGARQKIVMGERTALSRMTFSYVNALLEAGFDHPLETDELPALPEENMAEIHVKRLEEAWLQRRAKAQAQASAAGSAVADAVADAAQLSMEETEKKQKAVLEKTLLGAVWDIFGMPFMMGGIWKVPQDILSFASPFLVKAMYKYVDPKEAIDPSQQTWSKGLGICALFFLVQYVASVALHQYFDEVFKVSLQIRAGLVACVYRKALRLSHGSRSHKSLGELVNLMSVDVQRMTDLVPYLHNLVWSSPLQVRCSLFGVSGFGFWV